MGESTSIIIKNSTIHGPVAKIIQDSFNTVSAVLAYERGKELSSASCTKPSWTMLEEAKSKGQLTDDEEAAVARDLESFSSEAVVANPRRSGTSSVLKV